MIVFLGTFGLLANRKHLYLWIFNLQIMKKALKEIKLGYGLGNLKFGMTRKEVELMLGKPSFIDKYSHSDSKKDLTESWQYEFHLLFDL